MLPVSLWLVARGCGSRTAGDAAPCRVAGSRSVTPQYCGVTERAPYGDWQGNLGAEAQATLRRALELLGPPPLPPTVCDTSYNYEGTVLLDTRGIYNQTGPTVTGLCRSLSLASEISRSICLMELCKIPCSMSSSRVLVKYFDAISVKMLDRSRSTLRSRGRPVVRVLG
jgi:hypothetical protein